MKTAVYLDHNATAPIRPAVVALMGRVMAEPGNASSIHGFGRAARKHIEDARGRIARAFAVGPQQVIFNSGATEGNNTILKGFAGRKILVSAVEHVSVLESGVPASPIPVTADGTVDLDALDALLAERPALVSVMLVNNETGVVQPMADIARRVKNAGALLHVDAAQAVGRIPFTRESLDADFITLSSHKLGGPQGSGAIIMAAKAPLPKLIHGGGQERRQRAGTENVAAIAGFGLAAELAMDGMDRYRSLSAWRDELENFMLASAPGLRVHGRAAPRVANTISFTLPGASSETWLMAFDLEGIALSSGSACSSGTVKPSHVLTAMGVSEDDMKGSLRLSMGWNTSVQDLDDFKAAWDKVRARILK